MPIELGKILQDIADEADLRPSQNREKDVENAAWLRVAKKNNLSVHEARSIFKVLQKKYDQEKIKSGSTWKLFNILKEIHTPLSPERDEMDDEDMSMEENEEYEMLEVDEEHHQQERQDEDEQHQKNTSQPTSLSKQASSSYSNSGMNSDGESPTKSKSDNSNNSSPERVIEKPKKMLPDNKASHTPTQLQLREEKKCLNTLLSPNSTRIQKTTISSTSATAAALQKKGITLKKAASSVVAQQQIKQILQQQQSKLSTQQQQPVKPLIRNGQMPEIGKTVQLPESLKRKLTEDLPSSPPSTKKIILGQGGVGAGNQTSPKSHKLLTQSTISTSGSLLLKKDIQPTNSTNTQGNNNSTTVTSSTTTTQHGGIKVITFPAEPTNSTNNNTNLNVEIATVNSNGGITNTTTTTNGLLTPPRIEELDFSNNIIIESKPTNADAVDKKTSNDINLNNAKDLNDSKEGILSLVNMPDELPRNFFSNLCNSSRYESLALYIANVMNRLDSRKAAHLELKIMRAVIDAQSEALKES